MDGGASSDWNESWRSINPSSQQDNFTIANDCKINETIANKQDKNSWMSPKWEECGRLVNHHGYNKSKLPQLQISHSPEWVDSWKVVFNKHKNLDLSLMQDQSDIYNDFFQQSKCHLQEVMLMCQELKYRDLYLQLYNKFESFSEWSKSWQMTKKNLNHVKK